MFKRFVCIIALLFCIGNSEVWVQELQSEKDPNDLSESNPLYQKLLKEAQNNVDQYSESADAYFMAGFVHQSFSQYQKAIDAFQEGLKYAPNNLAIHQSIANLYKKLYEFEKAVEWYQKTIKINPAAPQANENLGLCLVQLNKTKEALEAFKRELEHYPNDASSHYYLAQQYFQLENYEKAKEHAQKCIDIDSRLAEPLHLIAKIHQMNGEMEKAKELLLKFNEVRKREYEIIDAKDTSDDKDREKAVEIKTHILSGLVKQNSHKLEQAEEQFLKAVQIDPDSEEPHMRLYNLYQATNRMGKAKEQLDTLLQINPQNAEYHKMNIMILSKEKRNREALLAAEKAHREVPQSIEIKRLLAQLYLSNNQNHKQALDLMLDVIANNGQAPDFDLLSWAYYTNGFINESLEALNRARKIEPNNPVYEERYKKLKQKIESIRAR